MKTITKPINEYLEKWEKALRTIIEEKEAKQIRLDEDEIKEELNKLFNKALTAEAKQNVYDFVGFYDTFIENHQHYTKASISILKQNRKHVIMAAELVSKEEQKLYNNYTTKMRGKMDLTLIKKLLFDQINKAFLDKFTNYLHTAKFTITVRGVEIEQNYKKNYIGKHIKQLRQIVEEAIDSKFVESFSLKKFKAEFEEVDSVYTDFEELQKFLDLDLEGAEHKIRNLYVLNCFLGMRLSDLGNDIKPHLFKKRIVNGKEICCLLQAGKLKQGNLVEFPLDKNAVRILEEWNYEVPAFTETEFNKLIKIIAQKAGLTQLFRKRETRGNRETEYNDYEKWLLMSSHSGRRSFCTNYYNAGWSVASIMAISGHKTEEEFLKYIKAGVKLEVLVEQLNKIPELKAKPKTTLKEVA